ncbi:MAG: hypothetical protein COA69_01090 [Robiginitomaculum sp.]|nr:MAG: hypothetical protein COA69_01090 [Robiginitomaculum sp.]
MTGEGPTPSGMSNVVIHPAVPEVSADDAHEYIEDMLKELCDFARKTRQKEALAVLCLVHKAVKGFPRPRF